MPVKTAAHPGKAGLGNRGSHHGTLVLAESGRLSSLEDTLASLGFSLIRPHKKFNPAIAVPPLIVIADSGGWKTGGEQTARAASAGKLAVRSILIEDDETGTVEMPGLTHILSAEFTSRQLLVAVREAHRSAVLEAELDELRQLQETGHRELEKLIEIGISLSSERNIDRLLDKILLEACNVTIADGGSIYIIDKNEQGERVLHFSNTISTSLNVDFKAFAIPINPASIAGYVAATGESLALDDCYKIPARYQFSINKSFDENNNYRTKSMLAVAMRNQKEEITGVIQLINRKPSLDMVLTSPAFIEENVISFDQRVCALIEALASQAAVALENYRLYRDIENLFEGFVQASVTAIESRDPTTCGHSERVATLTVGIAEMVNRITTGKLREVRFDENQLKEIRYAGLLHDFGKVGVREHVLLKAKKLYPDHLKLVRRRFDIARQIYRKETNRSKVEFLLAQGREEYLRQFKHIDSEMRRRLETLDRQLSMIVSANEPTVLDKDDFSTLEDIARIVVSDPDETSFPLLSSEEYQILSIPRGSLTPDERLEIESHVTHTFNFLTKIPWTGELQDIPEIAYGHHEKLDGSGYPRGIDSDNISLQTRMMTISDIYDALTATDRPYKPAVPTEKALDILGHEVNEGKIDPELFRVFVEAKVFNLVKGKHS